MLHGGTSNASRYSAFDTQIRVRALRDQERTLNDYKLPDFDIPGSTKWSHGEIIDPKGPTDRGS